ncbi:MAG: hypothetical protein V4621_07420 [Pseudomonadota bacterium]
MTNQNENQADLPHQIINRCFHSMPHMGGMGVQRLTAEDTYADAAEKVALNLQMLAETLKNVAERNRDNESQLDRQSAMFRSLGALMGEINNHIPKN